MQDNLVLLKRLQEGDTEALTKIVEDNMGLVRHVAGRFLGRGVEYDDLLQLGAIGLLRAARAFSFDYGCAFSTYAVPLIIGEIKRFLRDDGALKVSRTIKSRATALQRAKEKFIASGCDDPPLSLLATECGVTVEEAAEALAASAPVCSLNAPTDDEHASVEYYLTADSDPSEALCESIALKSAIRKLSPLQQQIVYLRYQRDLSQSDVGRILSLSQVKVSREEKKILALLKRALSEEDG